MDEVDGSYQQVRAHCKCWTEKQARAPMLTAHTASQGPIGLDALEKAWVNIEKTSKEDSKLSALNLIRIGIRTLGGDLGSHVKGLV